MKNLKLLAPKALPFDFAEWKKQPFAERVRWLCTAWATQGYGAPLSAYAFYVIKILFYVSMWIFFCSFSSSLGGIGTISQWWAAPEALLKFILWSMLFEVLGLGCGSGPLTARYSLLWVEFYILPALEPSSFPCFQIYRSFDQIAEM